LRRPLSRSLSDRTGSTPVLIDPTTVVFERSFPNFDSPATRPGPKMASSVFVADRPDRGRTAQPQHRRRHRVGEEIGDPAATA
jgi:hypothetical protein